MKQTSDKVLNALRSPSGMMHNIDEELQHALKIDAFASRFGWTEEYIMSRDLELIADLRGIMDGERRKQAEDRIKSNSAARKASRKR